MKPIKYTLELVPDLHLFHFQGKVEIEIERDPAEKTVILNINDLAIWNCQLSSNSQPLVFSQIPSKQELQIQLPEEMVETNFTIIVNYMGNINDQLVGLYRSKYEKDGQEKYIAVTQFEERDARRAFPCFDHPSLKAIFEISFILDNDLVGIANTPIMKEEPLEKSKKRLIFQPTPKMSTYLVFFGMGDFEMVVDNSQKPEVRIFTTPNKIEFTEFAKKWARRSLAFGEEYTQVPFPIEKCDFIAVPDFGYGAMENFGAITFRENYLLVYPGKTSQPQQVRIASIIAHEVAHMWFGDIVSPQDWKYVWLNESFANYFTYMIPDRYEPAWNLWYDFVKKEMADGMYRDSISNTIPIELPGHDDITIDVSTAPIIYDKGSAVLRMLIDHIGKDQFQKASHHFLHKYQFANATSEMYWEAFQEAIDQPILEFANKWIHQAGLPVIKVSETEGEIHFHQEHFCVDQSKRDNSRTWIIPIRVQFIDPSGEHTERFMLDSSDHSLPKTSSATFIMNPERIGYYRVFYEGTLFDQLLDQLKTNTLHRIEALAVIDDYYFFYVAGMISFSQFMQVISALHNIEELEPLLQVFINLERIYPHLPAQQAQLKAQFQFFSKYILDKLGWIPQTGESVQLAELRTLAVWVGVKYGYSAAIEFIQPEIQKYRAGESIDPDLLDTIIRSMVRLDGTAMDFCITQLETDAVPETEKHSLMGGLGQITEMAKIQELIQYTFEKIPLKNRFFLLTALIPNPTAITAFWEWIQKNLQAFCDQMSPYQLGYVLVRLLPQITSESEDTIAEFGRKLIEIRPDMKDIFGMGQELHRVNGRLRID